MRSMVLIVGYGCCVISLLCAVVSYLLLEKDGKQNRNEHTESGNQNAGDRPAERFFVYASFSFGGMSMLWFIAALGGYL